MIWDFDSPFLRREFGDPTLLYENRDMTKDSMEDLLNCIVRTIECEISKNSKRHIMEILETTCWGQEKAHRLVKEFNNLAKESVQSGRIKLIELRRHPVYKALIIVIRHWEKKDWHCHVSGSLSGEFVIGKRIKNHMLRKKPRGISLPSDISMYTLPHLHVMKNANSMEEIYIADKNMVTPKVKTKNWQS